MTAYIIVDVEVIDAEGYAEYAKRVPETLEPFGGRFLVRGGRCETLESGWQPKRVMMLAFPSMEKAKAWRASEIYAEPKALRQRTARARMIAVQGVA